MENFTSLPDTEQQDIIRESANRRGVLPNIIEKDFWVCWTLKQLYSIPEVAEYITFKGGTSLSKAYGIIERFSEDIDLTISRNAPFIIDTKDPMQDGKSKTQRERKLIPAVTQASQRFVQDIALPLLKIKFEQSLHKASHSSWQLRLDDNDKQTILFHYPQYFSSQSNYIKQYIKLEFGARGEAEPFEIKNITPYIAEDFPMFFTVANLDVPTLKIERTFWEKATILHALYHNQKVRHGLSRHYYDIFMLARSGIIELALRQPKLLEQVVYNKSLMFSDNKASYKTATIANLRLAPSNKILSMLEKDYYAMHEMFMGDVPEFNVITKKLAIFEEQIHKSTHSYMES